jgi:ketosteroid isomerase-like protein
VEHSNVAAYRRTADAFRARDTQALAGLIDGEVVWHVLGTTPLAGEIRGRETLFRWFDKLHQVTEGAFTLKEHDVLGTDDHVVALSDMWAVRDGVRVSVNVVSVMHSWEGRQQERWFTFRTPPPGTRCWADLLRLPTPSGSGQASSSGGRTEEFVEAAPGDSTGVARS